MIDFRGGPEKYNQQSRNLAQFGKMCSSWQVAQRSERAAPNEGARLWVFDPIADAPGSPKKI
jgi:hypothetical protein